MTELRLHLTTFEKKVCHKKTQKNTKKEIFFKIVKNFISVDGKSLQLSVNYALETAARPP